MRHLCSLNITCRLLGKDGVTLPHATIVDISRRGLGIATEKRLERGMILVVGLAGVTERFSRPLLVRVVRVVRNQEGEWVGACTFANRLSDDDLQVLLELGKQ
jgi:hypothetical protein